MPLDVIPKNNYPTNDPGDPSGGLLLSPKLSESGKMQQRAVTSIGQAQDIIETLISASSRRQTINGRILAKYNAERPYDQGKLQSEGLGWRSNFTTKPLPQMVSKVAPRFEEAVAGLKYLTNSALPATVANATEKSEYFQDEITKTIRARKGWKTLVGDIALDNALFGFTVVGLLDEFSWMPTHFSQDESFLPDGTKQSADNAQCAVLKEVYLPHELYDFIKDREAAETVGWNLGNTADAINAASPAQLRERLGASNAAEAWHQNAERELTVGSSYMAGASVINVYSLLVREVTGKVSHYRFAGDAKDTRKSLFEKEDRFESMSDCMAFFSFSKGNKKLFGSKGIGRELYELASMMDRMRNEVVDRGILSGKTFVQGDFKQLHRFRMSVVGAMVIVPNGWTFVEQKVDGNLDAFLKLDAYFSLLVDNLVGSTSPRTFQGDRVTKAEVDLFASREEENKDAVIGRFLEQFVDLVGTMQRRLCDPDTTDDDAKELQKRLKEKLSREEITQISEQPVAGTVRDLTPAQRQMIAALVAEKKGNPLYNARALETEDLNARMGAEFADKVLLPQDDPTETAEQQRLQLLEMGLLSTGQPVPVSPRDSHIIHLTLLMPAAETLAGAVMQGKAPTAPFEAIVNHITEHTNFAQSQGEDPEKLKPMVDFVKNAGPALAKLKALDEQSAQLQQQTAEHAGGAPSEEIAGQSPQ